MKKAEKENKNKWENYKTRGQILREIITK